MNVFIVGTASWFWEKEREKEKFEDFKKACKNMGAWLSNKHHVILAGTVEPTADHWIIEGVQENFEKKRKGKKKGKANIKLYAAYSDESHTTIPNLPWDWVKEYGVVSRSSNYEAAHEKALKQCDIVLVIGGKDEFPRENRGKTEHSDKGDNVGAVCEPALRSHKPVVGLVYYGSHGLIISEKTTWLYVSGGIPESKLETLNGPLDRPEDEKPFLNLLELIHKKNPLRQGNRKARWILLFILLILFLMALWSFALFGIPEIIEDFHIYNILLIALPASIAAGVIGGITRFHFMKKPHVAREGSTNGLFTNIILGLYVGSICGLIFWLFLALLNSALNPGHEDYPALAFRISVLSSVISMSVSVYGPKAVLKWADFIGRFFPGQ